MRGRCSSTSRSRSSRKKKEKIRTRTNRWRPMAASRRRAARGTQARWRVSILSLGRRRAPLTSSPVISRSQFRREAACARPAEVAPSIGEAITLTRDRRGAYLIAAKERALLATDSSSKIPGILPITEANAGRRKPDTWRRPRSRVIPSDRGIRRAAAAGGGGGGGGSNGGSSRSLAPASEGSPEHAHDGR